MNLEEKKELLQSMAEVLKGSKIEQMIMIADEGSKIVYKEVNQQTPTSQKSYTDEEVSKALGSIVGEGKPIDRKHKWAGAYWYLRWACNYPVDVQEFCKRINRLLLPDDANVSCCYDNIRKLTSLSFMNEDPREMDSVRPSKMDLPVFAQCREIALKLEEELKKMA